MAQLKDTLIQGSARVTDTLYTTTIQAQIVKAPTTSGGTTYDVGTNGQVLMSNGTSLYWSSSAAPSSHTHNYAGSDSAGGSANTLKNFQVSTTASTGGGLDAPTTNSHGYISGLTKAAWNYQQTDGSLYVQWYNASWITEIFQDYRTGQMSVRGKNNGTWQSWRRVLDETNAATILGLGTAAYTASTAYAASDHTQAVNKGGTNLTSYTIGDILYASASTTLSKLTGNTTTTRKFLRSVAATSGTAVAPAWDTVTKSDVGLSNVENTALSTWTGTNKITTVGTISSGTWNGSAIPIAYGGTGKTTAADAWTALGGGASGKHADSYFALASHGTHVTTATVQSALGVNTSSGSTTKCLTEKGTFVAFNNYNHPTGAGNNHIPSGGEAGQFLGYGGSSGTATWQAAVQIVRW